MTLLSVRQSFITKSGRYDLATTTTDPYDTDAGADAYIQAAQQYLEDLQILPATSKILRTTWSANSPYLGTSHLFLDLDKAYHDYDSDGTLTELIVKSWDWMLTNHPVIISADSITDSDHVGTPKYICEGPAGAYAVSSATAVNFYIYPIPDEDTDVFITGKMGESLLTTNASLNVWSTRYPHILVLAAMMKLTYDQRDTEAWNGLRLQLMDELRALSRRTAVWDDPGFTQLQG